MTSMLPNTTPPNKEWYHDRCAALAKVAADPIMFPPFLVASYCESVLIRIYGGPWHVIWLLLCNRLRHDWANLKERCWWDWHMYVRLRTREEILELWSAWLEKETGFDDREWPDEIEIEEKAEA